MFEQITHDKTASCKKVQVGDNRGFGRVIIVYVKESTDKNLNYGSKTLENNLCTYGYQVLLLISQRVKRNVFIPQCTHEHPLAASH